MKSKTDNKLPPFIFMLHYVKSQKSSIVMMVLFFILTIILQVIVPQILRYFVDEVEVNGTLSIVITLICTYMAIIIFQKFMHVLEQNYSENFGRAITDKLRNDTTRKFLTVPLSKHDTWSEGEVITRLDEDVDGLFTYFYTLFFKIIGSILLLIGILIALLLRNQIIALIMLVICIATIFIFKSIQDKGISRYVKATKATEDFNGIMERTAR